MNEETIPKLKERYGDFTVCPLCDSCSGTNRLKVCDCITCKRRPKWKKGMTCGTHHIDHKYLVEAQSNKKIV